MSDQTPRFVRAWLDADAPSAAPTDLLQRIDTATRTVRPRPGWLARLEGHHMDVIEGGRGSAGIPRLWLALGLLALALVAGIAVFTIGRPPSTPVVVAPTQSAGAPAATPTVPAPSPASSVSAQPGSDPVPAELLGTWYQAAGQQFWFILKAGDPACTGTVRTDLDCVVIHPASGANTNAIATVQGGDLTLVFRSGYCSGVTGRYGFTVTGDAVRLTERPGGCQGGDFALVRAGSAGAPTAPPNPGP